MLSDGRVYLTCADDEVRLYEKVLRQHYGDWLDDAKWVAETALKK